MINRRDNKMHSNALKVLKERGFVEWSSHNEELDEHF